MAEAGAVTARAAEGSASPSSSPTLPTASVSVELLSSYIRVLTLQSSDAGSVSAKTHSNAYSEGAIPV